MATHPQVRKQKLKLQSKVLHHRAMIAEHRDALKATKDELRALIPPKPKTTEGV